MITKIMKLTIINDSDLDNQVNSDVGFVGRSVHSCDLGPGAIGVLFVFFLSGPTLLNGRFSSQLNGE